MAKKLKRFHKEIYFPDDWEKPLDFFCESLLKKGSMTFSVHATEKVIGIVQHYGTELILSYFKQIRAGVLNKENVFEFYWYKTGKIYKACFRNRIEGFPVDIITVVSNTGNIITVYHTHRKDTHTTLNKNLYEKGK